MAPVTRGMRARAAASADRLPRDFLFEALLRRPVRELCRLRAVCPTWRSVTTDPAFIHAHAAAHPTTLFLVRFRDDWAHVYVVDLAAGGVVLKRIAGADGGLLVLCPRLTLACLAADWNRCRVLNPANGAVQALPQAPAPEHKNRVGLREPRTSFAIGLIASTNEHKVLRVFNQVGFHHVGEQLFEVVTISSSSSSIISGGDSVSSWRAKPSPDLFVEPSTGVVVDAVVYYLIYRGYNLAALSSPVASHSDCILSFDLGREEWRKHLAGPLRDEADDGEDFDSNKYRLGLAELKGCLVLVYRRRRQHLRFAMDLWFLRDFENGIWAKEYTIQTRFIVPIDDNLNHVKPILFLNDGRLVIHQAPTGLLLIWDPQSNKFEQVGTSRPIDSVGIYTGSLLSLR